MATLSSGIDALLDEMEDFVREHYGDDSAGWRSGDFAAGAPLEFKARDDGARVGHWTVEDVREFLLDWFPRTIWADEDLRADVPDCAVVFFRFMMAATWLGVQVVAGLWASWRLQRVGAPSLSVPAQSS